MDEVFFIKSFLYLFIPLSFFEACPVYILVPFVFDEF